MNPLTIAFILLTASAFVGGSFAGGSYFVNHTRSYGTLYFCIYLSGALTAGLFWAIYFLLLTLN